MAQIYLEASGNYRIDTVQGPDPLLAAFGSLSHDFIFAPTNLGAKLYTAKPDYILICAVTFGNYYLITKTESPFDLASLEGREITVFGANQTSDIIVRYLLFENNITATITYVDSVQTAMALFVADNSKIVLTAEPSLSVLESQITDLDVIDLQQQYELIAGDNSYPQAGIFARASLPKSTIDAFLVELAASIVSVNADPQKAAAVAAGLGYAFPEAVIASAIPRSNLGYKGALEVKSDLETYFQVILDMNANLIGGSLPDAAFYYQP